MTHEFDVFHLNLNRRMLKGATIAIVPGDPARVEKIACLMDEPIQLASVREYTVWLGKVGKNSVVICSTGIGGPSTSIAVEELAQLGIRTFIRIGTTGAIQPHIQVGELLITTGAVRLDGASQHFAPLAYPAVADFNCTTALVNAATSLNIPHHIGITVSSDTFYPGQERYDTYTSYVCKSLQGSLQEWQQLKVMNYEMEAATLFTMCATMGLRAAMISGVIVNRTDSEIPDHAAVKNAEQLAIKTVVTAIHAIG